ncbi:MAG: alpha/beta fold hydrolase [Flavobacteriales bacterium]|nr:alpha/beta fold hydrolase [Flavobacteriales bacterium]
MKLLAVRGRLFKLILTTIIVILTGGYVVVFHLAPHLILAPRKITDKTLLTYFNEIPSPASNSYGYDEFNLSCADGVNLNGWFINANTPDPKGTLVFIHGIGGSKEFFVSRAQRYVNQGLNVVLFDLRAHGKSTGEYCTYGFFEKNDVEELVKYIISKQGEKPIGLYGTSLGGAVALQAASICSDVDFVIVESTFPSMEEVVFEYMKRLSGVQLSFISDWALSAAGKKAGFDPEMVQPELAAGLIKQPALIVHGTADVHIPMALGKRNFDALLSQDKTWLEIPGADHNSVVRVGGEAYLRKVDEFILRQLN